jgi:hypothetical protein
LDPTAFVGVFGLVKFKKKKTNSWGLEPIRFRLLALGPPPPPRNYMYIPIKSVKTDNIAGI